LKNINEAVMGLRIHKVLGYGIKTLKHKDGKLTDARIDRDKLLELIDNTYVDGVIANKDKTKELWCKEFSYLSSYEHFEANYNNALYCINNGASIHYDAEFGLPNVLLFTWEKACHRYDNLIDHTESIDCEPNIKVLKKFGIYPYYYGKVKVATGFRPYLPEPVLVLLAYLSPAIKDMDKLIADFRVMIYTYWS
jgi:hypothetical protein